MIFILTVILFIFAIIFSFYIPGLTFLNVLKLKLGKFEKLSLSVFLGTSLFILFTYAFSWLGLHYLYFYILIIVNLLFAFVLIKNFKRSKLNFTKIEYTSLLLIIISSIVFSYSMFFSGMETDRGLQFLGVNGSDGIRHIAYTKNMKLSFPPEHPGIAGVELKGFHYFYDFMLSRFSIYYGFSVEDLYFRLFPFFISILYGVSFYLLISAVTQSKTAKWLTLFLAYFSTSFSLIFYVLKPNVVDLTNTPIVQPIGLMLNPFTVFPIALLICGIYIIPKIKLSWKYGIIAALLIGILAQIKIYAGIIGIFSLTVYSFYIFAIYKKKYFSPYFFTLVLTAFITTVTFFPNNFGQGGLIYYPLLFYKEFIQHKEFNFLLWEVKRTIFAEDGNFIRIAILYAEAVFIFFVLNLGLRFLILLKFKELFKKSFWKKDYNILIFSASFIAIFMPSFFIQSVSVFDTVQFFWILLPILAIPTGIIFATFYDKQKTKAKILFVVFILIFTLPQNLDFLLKYIPNSNSGFVPRDDYRFISNIENLMDNKSFFVFVPDEEINLDYFEIATPMIAAIAGRPVYLDRGNLPGKAQGEYKKRIKNIQILSRQIEECDPTGITETLEIVKTKYLLTPKKNDCIPASPLVLKTLTSKKYVFYIFK